MWNSASYKCIKGKIIGQVYEVNQLKLFKILSTAKEKNDKLIKMHKLMLGNVLRKNIYSYIQAKESIEKIAKKTC